MESPHDHDDFFRRAQRKDWAQRQSTVESQEESSRLFAEYAQELPLISNAIFYESMSGAKIMDSPYAIYRHLVESEEHAGFWHIWSAQNDSVIPERIRNHPRTVFVKRNTPAYISLLMQAKYVIGNSVLPAGFVRRKGQRYLNTWHGIAYKALGRRPGNPLGSAGSVYNLMQSTHVLTPCRYMTRLELTCFSLKGAFSGELGEIGYPRIDMQLRITSGNRQQIRADLNMDPSLPTILYAPTWRGTTGRTKFNADQLLHDLSMLSEKNANVIFLAHHMMLPHVRNLDYENVVVPSANWATNELIGISDLLITDYSSIFFDFLASRKPIIHYLHDYDEYVGERGVLLGLKDLPGRIVANPETLDDAVVDLLHAPFVPNPHYESAVSEYCPHDDGCASERAVKWFIDGSARYRDRWDGGNKRRVLYWCGRLDTTPLALAFLEQINQAATDDSASVTLLVSHSVRSNAAVMSVLEKLGPKVSVIARNGYEMGMTSEEALARAQPKDSNVSEGEASFSQTERATLMDAIYEREYRRIFGDATFDEVIVYDNVSYFWQKLATFATRSD